MPEQSPNTFESINLGLPFHEYECLPMEEVIERAELAGFEVIRANDFLLCIDLDTPEAEEHFARAMTFAWFAYETSEIWLSKSKHKHVTIKLTEPVPAAVRYGWEAALGSDPNRAALNYRDLFMGILEPSCLFKPKEKT